MIWEIIISIVVLLFGSGVILGVYKNMPDLFLSLIDSLDDFTMAGREGIVEWQRLIEVKNSGNGSAVNIRCYRKGNGDKEKITKLKDIKPGKSFRIRPNLYRSSEGIIKITYESTPPKILSYCACITIKETIKNHDKCWRFKRGKRRPRLLRIPFLGRCSKRKCNY